MKRLSDLNLKVGDKVRCLEWRGSMFSVGVVYTLKEDNCGREYIAGNFGAEKYINNDYGYWEKVEEMGNFKVGDKVERVGADYASYCKIGAQGCIYCLSRDGAYVSWNSGILYWSFDCMKKVEEMGNFKVGDIVTLNPYINNTPREVLMLRVVNGRTYVVTAIEGAIPEVFNENSLHHYTQHTKIEGLLGAKGAVSTGSCGVGRPVTIEYNTVGGKIDIQSYKISER